LAQHSQKLLEERHGLERQKAEMLADFERRRAEFEANVAKGLPADAEFKELRTERQRLQERLAEAEERLAERPAMAAAEALRLEELRCHLELTAETLREDQLARQREWERLQTEAEQRLAERPAIAAAEALRLEELRCHL